MACLASRSSPLCCPFSILMALKRYAAGDSAPRPAQAALAARARPAAWTGETADPGGRANTLELGVARALLFGRSGLLRDGTALLTPRIVTVPSTIQPAPSRRSRRL